MDTEVEHARRLRAKDASVRARDQEGRTPLDLARDAGRPELLQALQEAVR